jgi:hypothetical protein
MLSISNPTRPTASRLRHPTTSPARERAPTGAETARNRGPVDLAEEPGRAEEPDLAEEPDRTEEPGRAEERETERIVERALRTVVG